MSRSGPPPSFSPQTVVVLTGGLCAGKTTVARKLADSHAASVVSARDELRRRGARSDRRELQVSGAELELATAGGWLASAVTEALESHRSVIVDSARTTRQITALRGTSPHVAVVFLEASLDERQRRFHARIDPVDGGRSFADVMRGEQEDLSRLAALADVRVPTEGKSPEEVVDEVENRLQAIVDATETRARGGTIPSRGP